MISLFQPKWLNKGVCCVFSSNDSANIYFYLALLSLFGNRYCLLRMIKLFKGTSRCICVFVVCVHVRMCRHPRVNFLPFIFSVLKYCLIIFCCRENIESSSGINHQKKQNRFVPLSEGVTACAAHPLNGTIIAGTKVSSLEELL